MARPIEDLGKAWKRKYPGEYDDLTDVQLGKAVKKKYAPDYDDFTDTSQSLAVRENQSLERPSRIAQEIQSILQPKELPSKTVEQVEQLAEYYHPNKGRFTSWWQRMKSIGRSEMLQAIGPEKMEVIQQGAILENQIRQGQRDEADFRQWIASHAMAIYQIHVQEQLIEKALSKGRTLEDHQEYLRKKSESKLQVKETRHRSEIILNEDTVRTDLRVSEARSYGKVGRKNEAHTSKIKMGEEEHSTNLGLRKFEKETEIRVKEHKERSKVDVDIAHYETMKTLEAISEYKHLSLKEREAIRKKLYELIDEEEVIRKSNISPESKAEKLEILAEEKLVYREALNAQKDRLLEKGDRVNAGGVDALADLISSKGSHNQSNGDRVRPPKLRAIERQRDDD